jgi:daunorubicin resistance ABC transporter ATP-binding subunit
MIDVSGVSKSFGEVAALAGVDLVVQPGTIAALLGPNGAGKTTLVRIIATLSRPDVGRVLVAGHDVVRAPYAVRALIGLTGQYVGLDDALSGRHNLLLIGRLAGLPRRAARSRAEELIDRFDLGAAAARAVSTFSGGMRRRLDLAASLMSRPPLLILDEPTTGLDPAGRLQLWEVLSALRAHGTTMLLTTQYLEEADRLADLVHVIDRGKLLASGTAAELKSRTGAQVVVARFEPRELVARAAQAVAERSRAPVDKLAADDLFADPDAGLLTVVAERGVDTLLDVARVLAERQIPVADLGLREPSLDEAFLALTEPGLRQVTRS